MRRRKLIKSGMLVALLAMVLVAGSCSKKTCPAYSDTNKAQVINRA
ncbi:MAG TPA: hypothetical protein PK839_07075 [Tenuifilaceae bacterium]|nr:hypothetical protein [Tenuifilaceae bacterium]HOG72532.1 hypothetical protein [Tenuifilaceae bacterium]HOY72938.1 hypothetical protein [Tenuifilaceae bacterium]HRC94359.1 hypothetical protein [Tenuifilaceae bacterium]